MTGTVNIRAMSIEDIDGCAEVLEAALTHLRRDLSLPAGVAGRRGATTRIAHLLTSDPDDSLVAEAEGAVIGFTSRPPRQLLDGRTSLHQSRPTDPQGSPARSSPPSTLKVLIYRSGSSAAPPTLVPMRANRSSS